MGNLDQQKSKQVSISRNAPSSNMVKTNRSMILCWSRMSGGANLPVKMLSSFHQKLLVKQSLYNGYQSESGPVTLYLFQKMFGGSRGSSHHDQRYRKQQTQGMMQKSRQSIVQDQNFSNEILFHVLSAIESLLGNKEKLFKHYDRVNFSHKNKAELKSHFQTQVMLFSASRIGFSKENPNEDWRMPNNFTQQQCMAFLRKALDEFSRQNDKECIGMTKDVIKILEGEFKGLYIERKDFSVRYSKEEDQKYQREIVRNGMRAGQEIDKRMKEVQGVMDQGDLKAHLNKNSPFYEEVNKFNEPTSPAHMSENRPGKIKNQNKESLEQKEQRQALAKVEDKHPAEKYYVFKPGQNDKSTLKAYRGQKHEFYKIKNGLSSSAFILNSKSLSLQELCRENFQNHPIVYSFEIRHDGVVGDNIETFQIEKLTDLKYGLVLMQK